MNGFRKFAPLIIFLLGQLIAAVWWASSVSTTLDHLKTNQTKIETAIHNGTLDRYTGDDADKEKERQIKRDQKQDERLDSHLQER